MADRQRPRLSLDFLRGFEVAARHLSFTSAARELFVTQSAVSRQIKSLEAQLGVRLFRRLNRRLELTEAGHTLYAAVSAATRLVEQATENLAPARSRPNLTIASAVPFASFFLVPNLGGFTSLHPKCNVRVTATNAPTTADLEASDVGIWYYSQGRQPPGAEPLVDDEVLPVCAPELMHDLQRPLQQISDLAHHVLLRFETLTGGRARVDWVRWLGAMGLGRLQPASTLSFSQYDHAIQAAEGGRGIARKAASRRSANTRWDSRCTIPVRAG
jgi:LysR family transcriptional regulator, glycine cleavage system transcriptional activator